MHEILFVPLIIFMVIVVPIWLILHYATRNSASRKLTSRDATLLEEMHDHVRRMEDRIHNLERILDADSPQWRRET